MVAVFVDDNLCGQKHGLAGLGWQKIEEEILEVWSWKGSIALLWGREPLSWKTAIFLTERQPRRWPEEDASNGAVQRRFARLWVASSAGAGRLLGVATVAAGGLAASMIAFVVGGRAWRGWHAVEDENGDEVGV